MRPEHSETKAKTETRECETEIETETETKNLLWDRDQKLREWDRDRDQNTARFFPFSFARISDSCFVIAQTYSYIWDWINKPKLVSMCGYKLATNQQNVREIYWAWMKILQKV